jgi:hypothetical protein
VNEHHVLTDEKRVLEEENRMTIEGKRRHGFLTTWLVLMIVGNFATVLVYIYQVGSGAFGNLPPLAVMASLLIIPFSFFNVLCVVALFRWKKWGFWGACISSVVALFVNLSVGLGIGSALFGIVGVLLLYGVLHTGKESKGWPQLE